MLFYLGTIPLFLLYIFSIHKLYFDPHFFFYCNHGVICGDLSAFVINYMCVLVIQVIARVCLEYFNDIYMRRNLWNILMIFICVEICMWLVLSSILQSSSVPSCDKSFDPAFRPRVVCSVVALVLVSPLYLFQ